MGENREKEGGKGRDQLPETEGGVALGVVCGGVGGLQGKSGPVPSMARRCRTPWDRTKERRVLRLRSTLCSAEGVEGGSRRVLSIAVRRYTTRKATAAEASARKTRNVTRNEGETT